MSVDGPIDLKHGVTHFTYEFPPGTEVVDPSGFEEHIHYPMPRFINKTGKMFTGH